MNLISWFEIPALDLDRAIGFYSKIFNCQLTIRQHEQTSFAVFPHQDDQVAGCLVADGAKNFQPSSSGVLIYLNMEGRVEEVLETVTSLGGKIIENKQQIGPWGFRALILDTEGNKLALYSKT